MIKLKENPQKLMFALDRFLSDYYGDRQVKFQPNLWEIANREIPQSLKYYYSFIEKYPGKYGTLNTQDGLILNSGKGIIEGKLLIVSEYAGCWHCVTEIDGEDPPVWVEDITTWKLVCNSLSQFLVTFSLQEALIASKYIHAISSLYSNIDLEDLLEALKKDGWDVSLLWTGKYAWDIVLESERNSEETLNYFYSVEDTVLIWSNGWCATNYKNANNLLANILATMTKI